MSNPTTNLVVLSGRLSSDPRHKQMPSGDEMVSYEVTTELTDGRASAPVVWFSPKRPPRLAEGDDVLVTGVLRRRFFRAGGGLASRTEVVASVVAKASSRTAERALLAARAAVEAVGTRPEEPV